MAWMCLYVCAGACASVRACAWAGA